MLVVLVVILVFKLRVLNKLIFVVGMLIKFDYIFAFLSFSSAYSFLTSSRELLFSSFSWS